MGAVATAFRPGYRAAPNVRPWFLAAILVMTNAGISQAWATSVELTERREAAAQRLLATVFDRLDCEDDEMIDRHEVDDHFSLIWHPVDLDGSRQVSLGEYQRAYPGPDAEVQRALFAEADRDSDGGLSTREYGDHLRNLITLLDKDGDGEISRYDAGMMPHPTTSVRHKHEHDHAAGRKHANH